MSSVSVWLSSDTVSPGCRWLWSSIGPSPVTTDGDCGMPFAVGVPGAPDSDGTGPLPVPPANVE